MFAEESKFTGAILTNRFQRYGVSAVFAAICQSERSRLRQVILDETWLTDSELSECKVQGLQLRAADLTGTNCFKTYFSGTDLTDTEIGGITSSKDFAERRAL